MSLHQFASQSLHNSSHEGFVTAILGMIQVVIDQFTRTTNNHLYE
jgi:hypothetical protein